MATAHSLTVWQQLREAAVPVVAWWALLVVSFGAFGGVVLVTNGLSGENLVVLALFAIPTFGGAALGQVAALLRVRAWLVLGFGAMCWAASVAVAATGLGEPAVLLATFLFLVPVALSGGLWSLETNRAVWALWMPVLFGTAGVIVWAEETGADAAWYAGNKAAIWDIASLAVLGLTVTLGVVYLVSRETHRLNLWRRGPQAPLQPVARERGAARPRLSVAGVLLLGMGAVALTLAVAVVSPYLWRTGPADRPDDDPAPMQEPPPPDQGCNQDQSQAPDPQPPDADGWEQVAQKASEAAQEAAGALCMLLGLALLALLGVVIGGPPVRRLLTVRYLRDPPGRVAATERIEQGWRLVEIAMADAGVTPRAGEDAQGLARRARPVLEKLSPVPVHGLEEAAEVADRVRFGLGVGPADVVTMERFSGWVYDTVWERLDDREQVKNLYRPL